MTCRPTCIQPSPSNAHCGACHHTFSGVSAFDRHRRAGECLSPLTIGLRADHKGVWRYPAPDPTKRVVWPQRVTGDGPSALHRGATADENGPGVGQDTPDTEWRWERTPDGGWYSGPPMTEEVS